MCHGWPALSKVPALDIPIHGTSSPLNFALFASGPSVPHESQSTHHFPTHSSHHRERLCGPGQQAGAENSEDDAIQPVQVPCPPAVFVLVCQLTNMPAMCLYVPPLPRRRPCFAPVTSRANFAENHCNIS